MIEVIDILDHVDGHGMGHTVKFKYEGEELRYEKWHTQNGSGADFYKGDQPWSLEDDERQELLFSYLDEVLDEYQLAYEKYVNPAIETAVQNAIAASEAMLLEPGFRSLDPQGGQ